MSMKVVVTVGHSALPETQTPVQGKALEAVVDQDIARFNAFFRSLGNGDLSKFEFAAIKTYLHYKLVEENKG